MARNPEQPEAMRFETQGIREAVDEYKARRSRPAEIRAKVQFAVLDRRIRELENTASTQSDEERASTQEKITDLKHRREVHWKRFIAPPQESEPVRVAEKATSPPPVAEKVAAEPVETPIPIRRALAVTAPEEPAWPTPIQEPAVSSGAERNWAAQLNEPFAQPESPSATPIPSAQRPRASTWVVDRGEPQRRRSLNFDSRRVQPDRVQRGGFASWLPFFRPSPVQSQARRERRTPVYPPQRLSADNWFR